MFRLLVGSRSQGELSEDLVVLCDATLTKTFVLLFYLPLIHYLSIACFFGATFNRSIL